MESGTLETSSRQETATDPEDLKTHPATPAAA